MNCGLANSPGIPISWLRSAGPTNSTSTPSIAASSSTAPTAARDSTWNTPRTRSLMPRICGWAHCRVPGAAGSGGHAADPRRRVAHPAHRLAHVGRGLETRDHQPVRAQVQYPAHAHPLGRHHAHDGGRGRGLDRHQLGEQVGLRRHAVLEVDEGPVVAGPGHDLRGDDRPEVDEQADGGLAGEHATPEVGAGRNGRGGGSGIVGHGRIMPQHVDGRRGRTVAAVTIGPGASRQLPTPSGGYRYQWVMP